MAEMKHQEQRDEQTQEAKGQSEVDRVHEPVNGQNEDSSDGTSQHGSVGGTSAEEDPIVTPAAVAAAAAAQNKRPLSKQPSNGIHVLKPDGLSATANGLPPFSNGDAPASGDATTNGKIKEEDITFDPNGSYYMANACCELVHYRTAAILVGLAELVLIAAWATLIGYYYATSGLDGIGSKVSVGMQGIVAAVFLAVIILMLVGVMAEHPFLLWPHMIVQIVGIALGIGFTVVAVIAMCVGTSLAETVFSHIYGAENLPWIEKSLGPIWPFCLAVVFDFAAALGIWFYIVIKGCYEYLMDKAFFEKEINNAHNLSLKQETLDNSAKKPS